MSKAAEVDRLGDAMLERLREIVDRCSAVQMSDSFQAAGATMAHLSIAASIHFAGYGIDATPEQIKSAVDDLIARLTALADYHNAGRRPAREEEDE